MTVLLRKMRASNWALVEKFVVKGIQTAFVELIVADEALIPTIG